MLKKAPAVVLLCILAWAYQVIQPPPPNICGSPNGPPITAPRIALKDGRHLAYKEHGVPKDMAKYKIIYVHGFDSCRHDALPYLWNWLKHWESIWCLLIELDMERASRIRKGR
eukprot:TRINITY_DN6159_c0_g1_i7.p1 TRINITY_DN6159_c0_g1~~TRINITY_DN6159_c0_g1_i7.p1  ORF type:complete len:113 (-),score=13.31 TRINITY_DN6159_c0_g1_i7:924-1262(-)